MSAAGPRPRLSVVVCVHDVAPYVEPCLASIAAQDVEGLQVVVVDDGSTDTSGGLADSFAAGRAGWQVLHVPNGGLGRARNLGADAATGEYLAFVDGDDLVLPGGYPALLASLAASGSDFASGRVRRFDGSKQWESGLHRRALAEPGSTHIRRTPALLYDTTAWNKVYRRDFWAAHRLRFPEGVLYEDIPVTLPAHVLARQVDVVDTFCYGWRERPAGDASITQRRAELVNLRDRLASVHAVDAFLDQHGESELRRLHDRKVVALDLPLYLLALPDVRPEQRPQAVAMVAEFLAGADPAVTEGLHPVRRLMYELVREGDVELLVALAAVRRYPRSTGGMRPGRRLRVEWRALGQLRRRRLLGLPGLARSALLRTSLNLVPQPLALAVIDRRAGRRRIGRAGKAAE